MDTKLKKSHKLKNFIIALIVLIPAMILICLYPQMEQSMLDRKEEFLTDWEESKEAYENTKEEMEIPESSAEPIYYLQDNFVNYAIEASYYQYASLLRDASGKDVFTEVLDEHGWINDYYELIGTTPYYVEYRHQGEGEASELKTVSGTMSYDISAEEVSCLLNDIKILEPRKTQIRAAGLLGYLVIEYDDYGKISNIRINLDENVIYDNNVYAIARASVLQYENNANCFVQDSGDLNVTLEKALEVCPKNFKGIYLIYDSNESFVRSESRADIYHNNPYQYEPYFAPYDLYFSTGAYVIVVILALFVFCAAMILPFFKKLETGWEKLFSIPVEITLLLVTTGIVLTFGMCVLMSLTTMTEINTYLSSHPSGIQLLGYRFSAKQCYNILLFVNFLGWSVAFFLEYICTAQIRQFFCGPMYYIKHRFLGIRVIRWSYRKIKQMVSNVLDIDIHKRLRESILKIVIVNFVIVAFLCCIWFAGTLGALVYSVILYILLKKYGSKLQKQYQNILNATDQMAEGDLHIQLEEELGIFKPLGEALEGVQKGFAKAVAEEAKSQNMKNELITNVSHDLKTPLTAIITYVDLLKNENITEEERKSYIETLDLKSQRLKVLVEDLFEVSKANSGNVKMNFMEVDIVQLLKEVRVELSDRMKESDLDFRFQLPEEKVILSLDGQRTYRIFENLLNNAIKYSMPFSRVYIDVVNRENDVTITFKNVSAQELKFDADYLTERFVRGDDSRNSEGSGLGLAIAKSFTELQKGSFEVQVDGDLFKIIICFPKQ